MMRLMSILVTTIVIVGSIGGAYSQTPISKFEQVAGKWTGHASRFRVSLDLDSSGKFTARSFVASESGEANLQAGSLVIPLVEHRGTLQLVWDGNTLKGAGFLGGKTWDVTLVRVDRSVGRQ